MGNGSCSCFFFLASQPSQRRKATAAQEVPSSHPSTASTGTSESAGLTSAACPATALVSNTGGASPSSCGRTTEQEDRDMLRMRLSDYHENTFLFAPEAPRPLPVVVVTGFLGSGKTTLLQHLLSARENLRVAAVVHDLADLNVDAQFLTSASEKALRRADTADGDGLVVSLSGCACCPGFEDALTGVVRASLREGIDKGMLDYVCLETSGAADPRRLVALLEKRFGPTTRARLDRVVAVVDMDQVTGPDWLERTSDTDLATESFEVRVQRAQLACADVVVLNKEDLLSVEARHVAKARISVLCPHALVLSCSFGKVAISELLEVRQPPKAEIGVVSHEVTPAGWIVRQDLEALPRASASEGAAAAVAALENRALNVSGAYGHRSANDFRVIEWSCETRPLSFARLQAFLSWTLPACSAFLRRGKGSLWLAEDPRARWDWQLSGRLRYTTQRDTVDGFGGAASRTAIVLIFAPGFTDVDAAKIRAALELLPEPLPALANGPGAPGILAAAFDASQVAVTSGDPAFEILGPPAICGKSKEKTLPSFLLRFRMTGCARFGIPVGTDLMADPYCVDVDAMNQELAALVSTVPGGLFLGIGVGMAVAGKEVAALLWPVDVAVFDKPGMDAELLFAQILDVVRAEASPLLARYFAHVKSCICGQ